MDEFKLSSFVLRELDEFKLQMERYQLHRRNPVYASSGPEECACEAEEFIRSLQGCKVKSFQFEIGVRLEPWYVLLDVKRKGNSLSTPTKIIVFDRSGCHYVDGRQEPFVEMVDFLQEQVRLRKRVEIQDIEIKDVREESVAASDHDSQLSRKLWRAFIKIKLKWGEHTAVFGDLIDDVGMGFCPEDELRSLTPLGGKKRLESPRGNSTSVAEDDLPYSESPRRNAESSKAKVRKTLHREGCSVGG